MWGIEPLLATGLVFLGIGIGLNIALAVTSYMTHKE